jgi:NADPH-dependent curcumin reductase CurA
MREINRQWLLKQRPHGMVRETDFEYVETPLPQPNLPAGEILVRTLMLGFDPAMRGWMDDVPSYLPPVKIGGPMRASSVAQVVRSDNPQFPVGTVVQGLFGWQDYAVANHIGDIPPAPVPAGVPPEMPLGVLGGASITAYFGLLDVGALKEGETVVVSGAAGAVGCVVGQIAKIKNCRAIGIAGGTEKCAWLKDECGLDAVIDYKKENVEQRLGELCPKGIDVFFDNVGGAILEAGIEHIAEKGRIVLCGGISGYNDAEPQPGPRNLMNLVVRRVRMEGFIMIDFMDRIGVAVNDLSQWVFSGRIQYRNDIQAGFENIPKTFLRLFSGQNQGKQMLKLNDPQ